MTLSFKPAVDLARLRSIAASGDNAQARAARAQLQEHVQNELRKARAL